MMRLRGEINITFSHYDSGIFYFDLETTIDDTTIKVLLPRYDTLLGWIEIFGLPPQNEWVVLTDLSDFSKEAKLKVGNEKLTEICSYAHNKEAKTHTIIVTRKNDLQSETATWQENYSNAPDEITMNTIIEHSQGSFTCTTKKHQVTPDELVGEEHVFKEQTIANHGHTDHIWKKESIISGTPAPIYKSFFPEIAGVAYTDNSSVSLEIGYMHGGTGTDAVHGDWYKRITVGKNTFYIKEDGYSSRMIETEKGTEQVKATYRKRLYTLD